MSDEDEQSPDATSAPDTTSAADTPSASPRPGPGSAARRARRIGGRPAPAPVRSPSDEGTGDDTATPDATPPVALGKTPRPVAAPAPSKPTDSELGEDSENAEDADTASAEGGVRSLPLAWFIPSVLAIVLVGVIVLLGVFSFRGYWAKPDTKGGSAPTTAQQEQVLAAAKTCFAKLNSYDYRKLDDDFAAGLACTTGAFTTDYSDSFRTQVRPYAAAVKIVRVAQVNKAGIASISGDGKQWVILLFGQLQISNTTTGTGDPRVDPVGGVVTMDQVGTKWLVGKVDVDTGSGIGG